MTVEDSAELYRGPVVDIWMRPPTPGFVTTPMYRDKDRVRSKFGIRGFEPSTVLDTESMDQTVSEMAASNVALGTVPVRRGGRIGDVSNQDVRDLVQARRGRFIGFAAPDLVNLEIGHAECAEALKQPEFAGIVLEPGMWSPPRYVDNKDFFPIYELCRDADKPVMMTVGGNGGPDVSYCAVEPVDRVAKAFPDLTIIVQHGCWPRVGDALNLAYRQSNVYLSPDVYLIKMFGWRDYIDAAHGFLQDRILFGSGFPFTPYTYALPQLLPLLEPRFAAKLFFNNACTVMGIDADRLASASTR
jgi:predicted TIM-barrel fold metal-dependent hydrolase